MDKNNFHPTYPLQDHLEVDVQCEIVDFPSKSIKKCQHYNISIDSKLMLLKCKDCEEMVNPVIWIKDHIHYFAALKQRSEEKSRKAKEDYEELQSRAKAKCDNCGKMTGIKLKNYKFKVVE